MIGGHLHRVRAQRLRIHCHAAGGTFQFYRILPSMPQLRENITLNPDVNYVVPKPVMMLLLLVYRRYKFYYIVDT